MGYAGFELNSNSVGDVLFERTEDIIESGCSSHFLAAFVTCVAWSISC